MRMPSPVLVGNSWLSPGVIVLPILPWDGNPLLKLLALSPPTALAISILVAPLLLNK